MVVVVVVVVFFLFFSNSGRISDLEFAFLRD